MTSANSLVIFDLDGTLIDTMGLYAQQAAHLINKYTGLDLTTAQNAYNNTAGRAFCEQIALLFPHGMHNNRIIREYEDWKHNHLECNIPLLPGAYETLQWLQNRKIAIAISSNSTQAFVEKVAAYWPVQFDALLGYQSETHKKGKAHITYLHQYFGITHDNMTFIGDSIHDALLAKENNLSFIGITTSIPAQQFYQLDSDLICCANYQKIHQTLSQQFHRYA